MAFGIYIHIPYCLQICPYCDFSKFQLGRTLAPESYTDLVIREIHARALLIPNQEDRLYDTIYFGGGTPSLLAPELILSILRELAKAGFHPRKNAASSNVTSKVTSEVTIEIDPKTVDEARIEKYLEFGINRFSVGAQSFDDRMLEIAGRKHRSHDVIELLTLLEKKNLNYSLDLLFALPQQSVEDLDRDLDKILGFCPPHVSPYHLTVPDGHKLSYSRADDENQVKMFALIEERLGRHGYEHYEISNFARPGFASRHNLLYWSDDSYLGLGLSAHSYERNFGDWGRRFWNPRAMNAYADAATKPQPLAENIEVLLKHQSLTDFCHVSLRREIGLSLSALRLKFGAGAAREVERRLHAMQTSANEQLVRRNADGFSLTNAGRRLSNQVFAQLTFLAGEAI